MPARPWFSYLGAALVIPCVVAAADTGYRIRVPAGNAIVAGDAWTAVDDINRQDPEAMCRSFKAVQFVVPLNQATQRLEQSLLKKDTMDAVEIDFARPDRPYVRIELRQVMVTNVRTLDGSKQRVTMRYESCSVKEKKAEKKAAEKKATAK